jgi:PAS domain S-box-containing protein
MRSINTHLTAALLLCILLPSGLIGATAYWFSYNGIRENRIKDVGQIADARYEELRMRLHVHNERGQDLLNTLIAVCRRSNEGVNACARSKLEPLAAINHAVGFTLHSGIESDLAVGNDAIPFDKLTQPFPPGQIAAISKLNGIPLLSLIAIDSASGFSLVTTYPGQELQNIFVGSPVLGQSGETFLADSRGFLITQSRYPSNQGVLKPISAAPMQHCLHGGSGETLDLDYRDAAIIHGFRLVPEIGGGCIMAHIEQAEAFAPLRQLVMNLSVAVVFFAGFAWLIATILGQGMAKPIGSLADMARALSQGDFSLRAFSTSYLEIAELSQLFNSMAEQLDNTLSRLRASERELEQKVVELHEQHKKYDAVIQTISEGFCQIDREGRLLEANPAYARLSGYSKTDLIGMRISDLDTQEQTADHIRKVMLHGTDIFETRHRRKDRSEWDVEVSASFINEDDGYFVSFFRDISARKLIEGKLKASEKKFRSIIEVSPVPMALHDERLNVTFLNPAFIQTFGYSVNDIPTLADWWPKAYPDPVYRRWVEAAWQSTLQRSKQGQNGFPPLEVAIRCKNNSIKTVLVTAAAIHHDFEDVYLAVLYDITHRKQIEDKFNAIFNASVEGIITIDTSSIILSANTAVETIFGYTPEELQGCSISKLIPSSATKMPYPRRPHATPFIGQIQEIEGIRKNGSAVPLELSITEFAIDNDHYFANIMRDVSLRKHREQQDKEHLDELAHVTRLGLMGEMASGIAHEVNQPLAAISSYSQASINLIRTENPDLSKLTEILYKTQQQALRAGRIIHRMREFVKSHSIHRSTAEINTLISDAVGLCIGEIKQNDIKLTFGFENNLPPICVDHIQIEQVIINLIRNSVDALQNLPAKQQRQLSIQSQLTLNNAIQVRVKDNGPGFDEAQRQQILTPFYTTKADGMGMGLSITRSIIEAHEGDLHFNGKPGKGASFYFTLPLPIESERA